MAITFLVAVLVLTAGFAKFMAMCVNWICAQKLSRKYVLADKCVNLGAVSLYPLVLVVGMGWDGPRFLAGGSSLQVGPWLLLIAPGTFGFFFLLVSTICYWSYRPPACEVSAVSETIDFRAEFGSTWRQQLIGPGKYMGRVAALPGNQQFTIELSTKTYQLPGLPAHWDGLSIVHLSDFHFYSGVTKAYFEAVCDRAAKMQPDLFLFSGDLLDHQRKIEWLPQTLGRLQAPLGRYFVLGNHDWYLDPAATRREFERLGWTCLAGKTVTVKSPTHPDEKPLLLCGDETPWMGAHPDLTDSIDAFRILVSHTPDNILWARTHGIDLMLAGHTHGGQIRLPILGPVYSPSRFDCRYASGVFWLEPTLMYVTRGVSGKEPIRYNCPPEVTKLVLKAGLA